MNFLTSIIRKATRKSGETINILLLAEVTSLPDLETVNFYNRVLPGIDYDVIICEEKYLKQAGQFAIAHHLSLLKTEVLAHKHFLEILETEAKQPYLNHPYD